MVVNVDHDGKVTGFLEFQVLNFVYKIYTLGWIIRDEFSGEDFASRFHRQTHTNFERMLASGAVSEGDEPHHLRVCEWKFSGFDL